MKQKKEEAYWLYVLVSLFAAFVVGLQATHFFSTGSLIVNEEFKTPHLCRFASDCERLTAEKGIPLTCRLAFPASREKSCLPPLIEGKRCTVNEDCEGGLACIKPNPDALHWLCRRTPRKPGETCRKREDCGENHTCIVNEGDAFTTCQPFPDKEGERCAVDYDCPAGLKCLHSLKRLSGLVGVCGEPKKHGEPCWYERDCEEGLYCRDTRASGSVCMTGEEFKKMWR